MKDVHDHWNEISAGDPAAPVARSAKPRRRSPWRAMSTMLAASAIGGVVGYYADQWFSGATPEEAVRSGATMASMFLLTSAAMFSAEGSRCCGCRLFRRGK